MTIFNFQDSYALYVYSAYLISFVSLLIFFFHSWFLAKTAKNNLLKYRDKSKK